MAAVPVTFSSQGGHLDRVSGVRLQSCHVVNETVDNIELKWLVEESLALLWVLASTQGVTSRIKTNVQQKYRKHDTTILSLLCLPEEQLLHLPPP